ncbi:hypothetical protein [Brevundimonas nasdae]|uniref:Uncharacterized protein n=1 Tax=Brevundimonas nasdae TaxID=172043 RepID=A0ACD4VPM6_9CAUL|nr:hypothetical protein [Brevundimonas nasdae]WOB78479.1 hypothetical protein PZA08_14425 [Brevundimonas nasdae]
MTISASDLVAMFNDRSRSFDDAVTAWANDNLLPAFVADCRERIAGMVRNAEATKAARVADLRQAFEAAQTALAEAEAAPVVIDAAVSTKVRRGGLAGLSDEQVSIEMKRRGVIRKATLAAKKAAEQSAPMLERHRELQVYRTPMEAFTPLLDYRPEWFAGRGFDPSAGDGRMIEEIVKRGNAGPHYLNEIRPEEWPKLARVGEVTIGDYRALDNPPEADFLVTNPPFRETDDFLAKARTHIKGPIILLQQAAWATTAKRATRLRGQGLAFILHLTKRPKWEMDGGAEPPGRFYGFSWFVFLPDYTGPVVTDWLPHAIKLDSNRKKLI